MLGMLFRMCYRVDCMLVYYTPLIDLISMDTLGTRSEVRW